MAEAREAKRQRQGERGDRRKRTKIRFRDYASEWVESYPGRTPRGLSETTRVEYRRDVRNSLEPFFGGFWLAEIESPDVRDWFRWMEQKGASVSAVRKAKAALSALFATAKENGMVRDNPVTGVRHVPSAGVRGPRKRRPLTLAELERFMDALPSQWRLFFLLLVHSGVRVGEQLGLTWEDAHLGDDPKLTIDDQVYRGKRKRLKSESAHRTLPLSPGMAMALTDWRKRTPYPDKAAPMFPSKVGTTLDYGTLYKRVFVPARDAANIPADEVGAFHAFRHTLGSVIHASGQKTDRQLCDWLGHSDPAFTNRVYVGLMDEGIGDAAFLDELIPMGGWGNDGGNGAIEGPDATRKRIAV